MKIDFESAAKDLPLDRETLAKRISETPLDIREEYVSGLQNAIKAFNENCNILLSGAPLCEHLLASLNDERFENLAGIAELLNDDQVLEKIDQLIALTYECKPAEISDEQRKKHKELVDEVASLVKKLGNYENVLWHIFTVHFSYVKILRVLLFYRDKKKSDLSLKRYLGKISDESLKDMIRTSKAELKLFESIS